MPNPKLEDLESAALQLPQDERARLAERLLASLDEEDEILNEWIAVAEARLDALDRGEAQTVALESVLKDIRAGLRK